MDTAQKFTEQNINLTIVGQAYQGVWTQGKEPN